MRMKIVVNTRSLLPNKLDGIGWFTYQTMKRIVLSHPEHEFVFLFDRPYSEEFIFAKNVEARVLFPPARHPFLYVIYYEWAVRRVLKELKPDIFIAPDGLLSLGSKCKQLAVVHDINFLHYPKDLKFFYSKYYNYFVPKFVKAAHKLVTVSEFSRTDIANNYHLDPQKIDVVYNGINEGYIPLSDSAQNEVRAKYSEGKPYFLFVGSQSPRKNLIRLIEAFNLFKEKSNAPHRLLLAGSSFWGEEQIAKVLENSNYKTEILFTGRLSQDELEKIMASAEALTFVSYFEGFGIPLVEAMQCGIPIICSNTSCMPEIAGDAALYVDPFHPSDIAEKMLQLIGSKDLRKHLIEKGFIRKELFSWDKTANRLWKAVESVFHEHSH